MRLSRFQDRTSCVTGVSEFIRLAAAAFKIASLMLPALRSGKDWQGLSLKKAFEAETPFLLLLLLSLLLLSLLLLLLKLHRQSSNASWAPGRRLTAEKLWPLFQDALICCLSRRWHLSAGHKRSNMEECVRVDLGPAKCGLPLSAVYRRGATQPPQRVQHQSTSSAADFIPGNPSTFPLSCRLSSRILRMDGIY